MDEEELEQSNKKITIDNFFEEISSVDEVANLALQQSQENFNLISVNSNLLQGLQESIELIESDIQQITNYFIVQQDQRRKQLEIREQELSKRQDISQKRIDDKLQDVPPFGDKFRNFGDSLLQGAASVAQDATRPFIGPGLILGLSGLLGFKDGGEPPINQPSIVGEEGPEIFVPKESGTIIPNDASKLLAGLSNAADTNNSNLPPFQRKGSKRNRFIKNLRNRSESVNPYKVDDTNTQDFSLLTAISALEGGDSQARVDVAQSVYNRLNEVKKDISDGRATDAVYDYTRKSFKTDESGVFPEPTLSDVLLKDSQYQPTYKDPTKSEGPKTAVSDEFKNVKDRKSAILAMKSYYDKRGDKRSMKQIEDLYDQTVADLQDQKMNKSASAFVGGRTEFRGGIPTEESIVTDTDRDRGDGSSKDPDNRFFVGKQKQPDGSFKTLGTGTQLETGAAVSPLLKSDASLSPSLRSDNNFNVNVDKSAKNELISQNMLAPPENEDDVITLPPISAGGDDEPIEGTPSPFTSSDSQSDQIRGTESGIPFIDVISNPFLSVV